MSEATDKGLVSVVIPNWNGLDFIDNCLRSLTVQTYPKVEIIVVENGSVDGSLEFIEHHYPDVVLLPQPKNLGFAGGVNKGIKAATGDMIALLNNDAEAAPDWLERLVATLENGSEKVGFVTSKIVKAGSKALDSTGDFVDSWGVAFPRGRGEIDNGQYDQLTDIFSGSGGATLYRATLFEEIGLFDEDFFAYYEDVDLGFRAQLAGKEGVFEPKSIVYHHIGGTSGKLRGFTRYHGVKNSWYLYIKNMPSWVFWRHLPGFLFIQLRWLLAGIKHAQLGFVLHAYGSIIAHLPSTLSKRYTIQRSRKVAPVRINQKLVPRPLTRAIGRRISR